MAKYENEKSISEIGLKDLAEGHLKSAVDRLGKLVEHEDAQIALEASQLIVRLARPRFPMPGRSWPGAGRFGPWTPPWVRPWDPWGDPWGDPWVDPWGGDRAG